MKLGIETASVMNYLDAAAVIGEPKPVVGMGATILGWTDRRAATIVKVEETTGKVNAYIIEVVEDDYKVVAGSMQDGSAEYEYTPRADGYRLMYRKNRINGMWEEVRRNPETGRLNKTNGNGLKIGKRNKWSDPSF